LDYALPTQSFSYLYAPILPNILQTQDGEQQQLCDVSVSGLSIKATTTISSALPSGGVSSSDPAACPGPEILMHSSSLPFKQQQQQQQQHQQQQQQDAKSSMSTCSVLEPCDLNIHFHDTVRVFGGSGFPLLHRHIP